MTSTAQGEAKLFSDTQQTEAAQAVSAEANRTYGLQLNANNQLVVNVPWREASSDVTSVSTTSSTASTGNAIEVNPTTGDVKIQSLAFAGSNKVGHVPSSATASQSQAYLRADGTWVDPRIPVNFSVKIPATSNPVYQNEGNRALDPQNFGTAFNFSKVTNTNFLVLKVEFPNRPGGSFAGTDYMINATVETPIVNSAGNTVAPLFYINDKQNRSFEVFIYPATGSGKPTSDAIINFILYT